MTENSDTVWFSRVNSEAPFIHFEINFPGVFDANRYMALYRKRTLSKVKGREVVFSEAEAAEIKELNSIGVRIDQNLRAMKAITAKPDRLILMENKELHDHQSVFSVGGGNCGQ